VLASESSNSSPPTMTDSRSVSRRQLADSESACDESAPLYLLRVLC